MVPWSADPNNRASAKGPSCIGHQCKQVLVGLGGAQVRRLPAEPYPDLSRASFSRNTRSQVQIPKPLSACRPKESEKPLGLSAPGTSLGAGLVPRMARNRRSRPVRSLAHRPEPGVASTLFTSGVSPPLCAGSLADAPVLPAPRCLNPRGLPMTRSMLMPMLLAALSLAACDRPTVVNVPAAPAAPAAVAGPPGPQGATGVQGNQGATGTTGDKGEAGKAGAAAPTSPAPPAPEK